MVEEAPVIEEEAHAVVEEERKIFIGISLSLKSLMEEISNEDSD